LTSPTRTAIVAIASTGLGGRGHLSLSPLIRVSLIVLVLTASTVPAAAQQGEKRVGLVIADR